jgi:hypothetical protein
MMYHILLPTPRQEMSGWGFGILLWPPWREAVARRALTQENVNTAVGHLGRGWLDACGFSGMFDPDNCGHEVDRTKKPGPRAHPMYRPNLDLRVSWGEWGPEHITVPGNACGLDLDSGINAPRDGRCLQPHNVDCMRQAVLLLLVFQWFADDLVLDERMRNRE